MSVQERIEAYIRQTNICPAQDRRYNMDLEEVWCLADLVQSDQSKAIALAFLYGRAKGLRAAAAER